MKHAFLGIIAFASSLLAFGQETKYQEVNRLLPGDWLLVEMSSFGIKMPIDTNKILTSFVFKVPAHAFVASTPMGDYDGFWDVNATADSVAVIETQSEKEMTSYKIDFLTADFLTLSYMLESERYTFYFRRRK